MASKTQAKGRSKGTGSIIKKRNRFYFRTREGGKEKYTLLRNQQGKAVTTRPDAEAAAALLAPVLKAKSSEDIAEYLTKTRGWEQPCNVPIDEVWETYLAQASRPDSGTATLIRYKSVLSMFQAWLAEEKPEVTHLSLAGDDVIKEFFGFLSTKGISGRTYNGYRQGLRLIYKHLLPVIGFEHNPVDQIANRTKDSVSRREFTEEQVETIFRGFDTGFFYETEVERLAEGRQRTRVVRTMQFKPMHQEQLKVLLYLCCYTGCRGQDGCLMRWSNVDLQRNWISFIPRKTARKTGKTVTIPLHPTLRHALEEAKEWQDTNENGQDYILPAIANRYQYNPGGIQKDVMKVIRCATGLETTSTDKSTGKRVQAVNLYSLHSFRHTFVSFCANAGVSLDIVAEIVGHGSPIMTKHYAHFSNEVKSAIINALPSQKETVEQKSEPTDESDDFRQELRQKVSDLNPAEVEEMLKMLQEKAGKAKKDGRT